MNRGRWRVVVRDAWTEELALYLAALSEPGTNKSAVVREACRPVRVREKELRAARADEHAQLATEYEILKRRAAAAVEAAAKKNATADDEVNAVDLAQELARRPRPVEVQLLIGDCTPEKLGVHMAEQGGAMASLGAEGEFFESIGRYSDDAAAPPIEIILHAYNGEPHRSDRVTRGQHDIERTFLAIGLIVQPDIILNAVRKRPAYSRRGLLPRFLFALPPTTVGTRTFDAPDIDPTLAGEWHACVAGLLDKAMAMGGTRQVDLRLLPDARDVFAAFWTDLERRMHPDVGDLADVRAWASKLAGTLVRVAGILTLAADRDAEKIDAATMAAAVGLADYLIAHARAVLCPDRHQRDERKVAVLAWLRRRASPKPPEPRKPHGPSRSAASPEPPPPFPIPPEPRGDWGSGGIGNTDPGSGDAREPNSASASRGSGGFGDAFTARDAWQALRGQAWAGTASNVHAVLDQLAEDGWLRRRPDPPRPRGGRPSPAYDVNPAIADLDL